MKYTKEEQKLIDDLYIGPHNEEIENPFSGRTCLISPLGVALYDFIKGCEFTCNYADYADFDTARNLFSKLYPTEYSILLD